MGVTAVIAGRAFELDASEVESALEGIQPDPITDHYVVVGGRRFPPKQVVGVATGLDRADFTTHHARRTLRRLGFAVGRRTAGDLTARPTAEGPYGGAQAEALRPYAGKWVAIRGPEVLVSADDPAEVVAWLQQHEVETDGMLRVPASDVEMEAGGPY